MSQDAHRLRAEIHGPEDLRCWVTGGETPADPVAYRLTDGAGRPLGIRTVVPFAQGAPASAAPAAHVGVMQVVPSVALDPLRVHYLEIPGMGLRALVRRDPLFREMRSAKELGAVLAADGRATSFRIFSPRATAVNLFVYEERDHTPSQARHVVRMARDADGVWEAALDGDLHGAWYDFTVHGPADPGNWFHETHPVHVSDPYARVNDDALGKSRVWRDGPPPAPVRGGRPAMEDVVAYEVHVQDFTDLLPVPVTEVGALNAMALPRLTNRHGEAVGLDHLEALGVNVVHLMPVQEYLHYPDDAWRADLGDDPFAREMGIDAENYQWGYRTTHAFAVESRFRAPGTEPGTEREQFKALVAACHERGMSVVIDLVPNHTGENMDHRHLLLHFNVLDLPYWYRTDDDVDHIGPFGNEVKTEERPMVRRWLLDQMRHWVDDLGVDGFRIDLAGQIDRQTLLHVRKALPADVLIYGEPWIPPSDPDVRANPDWSWYKGNAPITFFQDDARNAFQGSPFDVNDRGWAGGNVHARDAARWALANEYADEPRSTCGISYLDIHDNWALADRYALEDHDGRKGVDLGAVRLAAGLLLTSAGPVVIHGGTEMLRTKGLAPMEEREVQAAGGPILFRGRSDTYNLRAPNHFVWDALAPGSEQAAMRDYWRGLIALRMSDAGAVFRVAHYRWITPDDPSLLGYEVGGRVLVLANNGPEVGALSFELARGPWRMVGDGLRVDPAGVPGGARATLAAGTHTVPVPASSMLIWVRDGA